MPRMSAYEYRVNSAFAVFGRAARAFRLPNADERVGAGNPFSLTAPANFDLKTQTSSDVEAGIPRELGARFNFESSVYTHEFEQRNSLSFRRCQQDVNLDPTERTGWESTAHLSDHRRRSPARRRGLYAGEIPRRGPMPAMTFRLVSRWTGNAGIVLGHL